MAVLKTIRYLTAAAALLLGGSLAYVSLNPGERQPQPISALEIGGPFELASSNGGTVKSSDLVGKPYGVFFGFTQCPEVCPTTIYEMSASLETMGDSAKDFRLFFITVDPERDTADKLKDYLSSFDPRIEALVPTTAQLPDLAKGFRAIYEKVPTSSGDYTMNHTASVFLFARDGKFRSTIAYGEDKVVREKKIRSLLAEGS
jgi:protein SCO1